MNKSLLKLFLIVFVVTLLSIGYFQIFNDNPRFENFSESADNYKIIAQLALNSYNDLKSADLNSKTDFIIIDICDNKMKHNDSCITLTNEQKKALLIVEKNFKYLCVYDNAVFFRVDETGYYGLVYSKNPLYALYKAGLPQEGREYNRIYNNWYEWYV